MTRNMLTAKAINPKESSEKVLKKRDARRKTVISGQLEKKLKKRTFKKPIRDRGLVLVRHIPHGFFEEQLKGYFEQFGTVTRVRVVRSKRTGSPKGFAYVEFQYPEVAKVAAETMDNYLMFQKLIKATYIPPEQQHFNYFKTSIRKVKTKSGKYKWLSSRTASIQRKMSQYNNWSEENYKKRANRQLGKIKKLCTKFSDLGIDINHCVVQPHDSIESEKQSKSLTEKDDNTKDAIAKSVPLSSQNSQCSHKKRHEKTNVEKDISLRDLLGDTIQEDSDDEDYTINNENISLKKLSDKLSNELTEIVEKRSGIMSSTSKVECIDEMHKRKKLGDVKKPQSSQVSQSSDKNNDEKSKLKKDISLKDLLGDTIQEDSEDEDYAVPKKNVTLEKIFDKTSKKMKKTPVEKCSTKKSMSSVLMSNKLSGTPHVESAGELLKHKKHGGVKKVNKNKQTKGGVTKQYKENIKELAQSITQLKSSAKVMPKKGKHGKVVAKS